MLMSATINVNLFANFFNNCPILEASLIAAIASRSISTFIGNNLTYTFNIMKLLAVAIKYRFKAAGELAMVQLD